jgi:excinuclease ABC subunit B
MQFKLVSENQPKGDQPEAIEQIVNELNDGTKDQVLLGITGSGKTFTIANVIEQVQRPTLVLAHNKTLAAQLYQEFKTFFPKTPSNISFLITIITSRKPTFRRRICISKKKRRSTTKSTVAFAATRSLFERRDVIVVASVSCIYGLGDPDAYYGMILFRRAGQQIKREEFLQALRRIAIRTQRHRIRARATFRVRGDVVELYPSYQENAYRIEFWGDEIDSISTIDPLLGEVLSQTRIASADLSENALCDVETDDQTRVENHQRRTRLVGRRTDQTGQNRRIAAAASAHDV